MINDVFFIHFKVITLEFHIIFSTFKVVCKFVFWDCHQLTNPIPLNLNLSISTGILGLGKAKSKFYFSEADRPCLKQCLVK